MVCAYRCVDVVSRCTLCRCACVRAPVSGFACTEMVWHVCRVHVLRSAPWDPPANRARSARSHYRPGACQGMPKAMLAMLVWDVSVYNHCKNDTSGKV